MAVLEDRRRDVDRIALGRLDGIPSAVDLRAHVLDLDPGRAVAWRRVWARFGDFQRTGELQTGDEASTIQRRRAAPDLASERQARRRRLRVRRLARGRRPELVAGAAARAAGRGSARRTPSASAFAAWEGFLADPRGAASSARERTAFRRANAFWIEDWAAAGGSRRRSDPLRPRVVGAARVRRPSAACALIGDVPIYVAQGSVDHRAHPSSSCPGLVAGAPPDKLGPLGQHWGNPLFDWDAARARRLPLVDRAAAPHARALRPRPGSTTSAASRSSGRSRAGRTGRALGQLAAGPGRRGLRGRRGRARAAAGDRGGPRPDHARRRRAARPARVPGDGRPPLGLPGAGATTRTGSRTTASTR